MGAKALPKNYAGESLVFLKYSQYSLNINYSIKTFKVKSKIFYFCPDCLISRIWANLANHVNGESLQTI